MKLSDYSGGGFATAQMSAVNVSVYDARPEHGVHI